MGKVKGSPEATNTQGPPPLPLSLSWHILRKVGSKNRGAARGLVLRCSLQHHKSEKLGVMQQFREIGVVQSTGIQLEERTL